MKNVTCENKRMGAMQFDYAGSTLTFPPGLDRAKAAKKGANGNAKTWPLLHSIHGMFRTDTDFVGERFRRIDA